jgi:hypothetical protein
MNGLLPKLASLDVHESSLRFAQLYQVPRARCSTSICFLIEQHVLEGKVHQVRQDDLGW